MGLQAHCPAHDPDRDASLSVDPGDDGRVLVKCFLGCSHEDICAGFGIKPAALFADDRKGRGKYPPRQHHNTATPPGQNGVPGPGCTLAQYAEAKLLPAAALRMFGLTDAKYGGAP